MEDVTEIVKEFPSFYSATTKTVLEIIELLRNYGYISVKYNDGEKLCVTSTPKGTVYLENLSENASSNSGKNYLGLSFFGGFLGGFLGSVLLFIVKFFIGA